MLSSLSLWKLKDLENKGWNNVRISLQWIQIVQCKIALGKVVVCKIFVCKTMRGEKCFKSIVAKGISIAIRYIS